MFICDITIYRLTEMLSNLVAINPNIEFLTKQTKVNRTSKDNGRFNLIDYHIISREKGREKIFRQFSKTPFTFNAYVLMGLQYKVGVCLGSKNVLPLVNNALQRDIQTPNEISMIYVGNVTAPENKLPLNGWTLAHRIGHALTLCKDASPSMINVHDKVIFVELTKLYNLLLKTDAVGRYFKPIVNFENPTDAFDYRFENIAEFSNMILTMKSARDKRIHNPVDISAECIAQYIINGKVHLNRAENCDINQITHKQHQNDFNEMDPKTFDPLIEETERKINEACHTVISNVVGKVICF